MLISFWWVVVAFILGGTSGAFGLAILSAMTAVEGRGAAKLSGIRHTD